MFRIQTFTFNDFSENTYVIYNEEKKCFIVDAGNYVREEHEEIIDFVEANLLKVEGLINTHCHIDHVLGVHHLKEYFKTTFRIHHIEQQTLASVKLYAPLYGFTQYTEPHVDAYIATGEKLALGNDILEVLFVPGHSPGHIAFVNTEQKICIAGDVLFYDSIGRTDLPGGNFDTLIRSIHTCLFTLPDDVTVYCGHGPSTTIGREKKHNPFCSLG
ncbi:MAG: MBL fold metallo-hydrolase [Cytophagaceae bacterium]|nr:MBL fold metallo-hydrolase [Cytophagaceae bacterium]MDW8456967.1 MBL fold metallo-hydrolase [Cytophagaceae bacterium]